MRAYYDRCAPGTTTGGWASACSSTREWPGWSEEVAALIDMLAALPPARLLDVACGTGFLTRHLRGEVVALDQSSRMVAVAVAAARMPRARVIRGDAVPLPFPGGAFDRVLTSHFYGHLLPDERAAFLNEARRVGRELVIVDSARRDEVGAEAWQVRTPGDRSTHRVYKRFFHPDELAAELGGGVEVLHAGRWFVAVASSARPVNRRPASAGPAGGAAAGRRAAGGSG